MFASTPHGSEQSMSLTDNRQFSASKRQIITHLLKRNRLLAALSVPDSAHFIAKLELVKLTKGKTLYHLADTIHYAYFPLSGMVSILSTTEEGLTTEISMVGTEGVVGIPVVLRIPIAPYEVAVQMSGEALRVSADLFRREFDKNIILQSLVLRYLHTLITHISQSASCNRFHALEERLCRWLLIGRDCIKSNSLKLTQVDLSHMLGASRPAVTNTAKALQQAKIISYSRGQIEILDDRVLQAKSCECYRIISEEINQPRVA